jgi:hypothetical protein
MRMERCELCSNYIDINSDHAAGCPNRQNALYFRDDTGAPVYEGDIHYCLICGDEFKDWRDTIDHGHDSHGLYHFENPTTLGPRPVDMKHPLTYEEIEDRTEAWRKAAWEQT